MGCGQSPIINNDNDKIPKETETEKLPQNIDEIEISNQAQAKQEENNSISNNRLLCEKAESSVVKIIVDNKVANGFFCRFKYFNNSVIYLLTCYHVITKQTLDYYDEIKLRFKNNSKTLNLKEKRNILYNDTLDFIAIEIKDKDKLNLKTFEINENCYNYEYDNNNYNKRSVIIPCLGENNEIELSSGIINYSDNKIFLHNCNTKPENSGAPILFVNNAKIIGMYTGYEKQKKKNVGLFFQNILKYINSEQNKIEVIIEIDEINKVKLINNNEDINIFKNKEEIYLNEDNTIFFENKGKYNITIIFNNNLTECSYLFDSCNTIISIDLSNFETSKINNFESMFNKCCKLKEIKGIENFKTNNAINMSKMFQGCKELESLNLSNFDTSKVNKMNCIFNDCNKLKEIKGIENFKTTNVIDMSKMFQGCNELESLNLSNFDTSKVNNMKYMFNDCNKLKEIKGIEKFNINNVTNISGLFQECNELESLNLSNFDTSKVNNINYMFNECHKLKEIKGIENFITNNIEDMTAIFQACYILKKLDLSNFDTSKVKNMDSMFNDCHTLKEIKGIENFKTHNVVNFKGMFQECNELESLDLSNFETLNANNISLMFNECHKLKEIKGIENFNTNNVTDMNGMFQGCKELESLNLSNFDTSKVNNMQCMFNDCNKL